MACRCARITLRCCWHISCTAWSICIAPSRRFIIFDSCLSRRSLKASREEIFVCSCLLRACRACISDPRLCICAGASLMSLLSFEAAAAASLLMAFRRPSDHIFSSSAVSVCSPTSSRSPAPTATTTLAPSAPLTCTDWMLLSLIPFSTPSDTSPEFFTAASRMDSVPWVWSMQTTCTSGFAPGKDTTKTVWRSTRGSIRLEGAKILLLGIANFNYFY
mmetsp:Transcript_51045/g.121268  ORF Transcript_51045/g.121268 Transcript_51045/m.121268 type:complete len:218 (+) Transcript_51045:905-1558(+)